MNCLDAIRQAGVIGCGGAGFPTHVKLKGEIRRLIVNCMECEPLLHSDRYVLLHFADRLVAALAAIAKETGIEQSTFAIKETYLPEITVLRNAIAAAGANMDVHTVTSYYPAGDEQAIVYEVTGRTVPPLNIPLSVGCAVINVGTLLACQDAIEGMPFTHRYVTVSGHVKNPCVVYAPIGTPFSDCIALAGGVADEAEELCIVSGGPAMGKRFDRSDLPSLFVEKTTSGILTLPTARYRSAPLSLEHIRQGARAACIQCSYCTELCPRHLFGHPLEPHKIMRKLAYNQLSDVLSDPVIQSAALCSECGVCELYACPMQLQPRRVNALIKRELAKAGIRYPKSEASTAPSPLRELRLVPSMRMASRAGVLPYYETPVTTLKRANPDRVSLARKQGVGVPSEPLTATGDVVKAGRQIAVCPDGSLGSNLYAPIAGRVTVTDTAIIIER